MTDAFKNLGDFAAAGFTFPDHTAYIWAAYGASFLTLLVLFLWTQIRKRKEMRLAAEFRK